MDIVDGFKARANQSLSQLQELAGELHRELETEKALSELEKEFERLAADGELDEKDRQQLALKMKQLGLDPSILEGELSDVTSRFEDVVEDARATNQTSLAETTFLTRIASDQYATAIQAASYVQSERHKAYMNVIENLRA